MNLPLFIALRYLFSKKKQNIINIISGISVSGIIVGTMALVIVLSVFNGFNSLIGTFFSNFDPDLKITPTHGKMFVASDSRFDKIKNLPGVLHYAEVIEEVALLKYGNQQYPAVVKGVPPNYSSYTNIDTLIVDGIFMLEDEGIDYAVVGQGVAYNLGLGLSFVDPIRIFVPQKGKQTSVNLARSLNYDYIFPSGVFSVLEEIDSKYMIVPYHFAASLFESGNQVSAVELGIDPKANGKKLQNQIQEILGDSFHVKNKYQQHDLIFRTMKSEKWASYLILVFILIVASFNMLGSLSMLIIDKKEDLFILRSMGADSKLIRKIFLFEGWLISVFGAVIGSLLGVFICWLQIRFEIVTLPGAGSFIISAYPVEIVFSDILFILGIVLGIGFVASWYPVRFISHRFLSNENI
ncbi:lipoprotein-releasing system permease protein [Mariniphaga anaerophila]|uniref:Lipoprotein-releasing system permease protein n=1 Tax=Mariniphaga anaerophila TaxID=1484053 RepID=A0A1M5ELV6_9BACT|nr:FtsX-like permease family protein [Mariniphaga anaerophila]SHF80100.1 lipoprotein-releasing system permease protein [Mariniphaga anaerophila]